MNKPLSFLKLSTQKAIEVLPNGNCLIPLNCSINSSGYPMIYANGKVMTVARYVYEQLKGPIPQGCEVRHTCDNKSCVNPTHLIIGTHQDNMRDMWERNPPKVTKLNTQAVIEIRQDQEHTLQELADKYKVSKSTIWGVRRYRTWKHVKVATCYNPNMDQRKIAQKTNERNRRLTIAEAVAIRKDIKTPIRELASRYGVSFGLISHIQRGRNWKHLNLLASPRKPRPRFGSRESKQGEKHPLAKLTNSDVEFIRTHKKRGMARLLAKLFNITVGHIYNIRAGYVWKHLLAK